MFQIASRKRTALCVQAGKGETGISKAATRDNPASGAPQPRFRGDHLPLLQKLEQSKYVGIRKHLR